MYQLFHTPPSVGLFLGRIGLALLVLFQAVNALLLPEGSEWESTSLLSQMPVGFAILELIIGILLLLGCATRLAALTLIGVRVYTILSLFEAPPVLMIEAHACVGLLCLLLLFTGGGALSVDRVLSKHFLP